MLICIIGFYEGTYFNFKKSMKNHDIKVLLWNEEGLISKVKKMRPDAIILSGSDKYRILDDSSPKLPKKLFELNIPILGICFGYQTIVKHFGGKQCINSYRDLLYKPVHISIQKPFKLHSTKFRMNHHDDIISLPEGFKKIIYEGKDLLHHDNEIIGVYNNQKKIMGIVFHPEPYYNTDFFESWMKWIKD